MSCKADIRREMIEKRKALDIKNGEKFEKLLKTLDCYKNAKAVMLYMPIKGEADMTGIMSDEKIFLVPVTDGDDMYAVRATDCFENGAFGVPEPKEKELFDKGKIDVVLVPGVAFDKRFNRMGFGKGYYDKFLNGISAVKIGVCHSFQLLDIIPCEEHDVKMDMIITEDAVWKKGNTL